MEKDTSRENTWAQIDQPWDLLVIGGGITGAGILREAARLVRDAAEAQPKPAHPGEPVDDSGVRLGAAAGLLGVPTLEERKRALEQ